jgi:hypothetical protein
MGPIKRAQERERAAARAGAEAKRGEAERKAIADAQKIVAIWNARQVGWPRALVPTRRSAPRSRPACPGFLASMEIVTDRRISLTKEALYAT